MARALSLVSILVALLVSGWLLTQQSGSPSNTRAKQEVDRARATASGVAFEQAQAQLEQFRTLNGTYAGVSLAGFGVTLARADAASYCIQNATDHLAGPDGSAAPGPC